jgi:hypothetical protein
LSARPFVRTRAGAAGNRVTGRRYARACLGRKTHEVASLRGKCLNLGICKRAADADQGDHIGGVEPQFAHTQRTHTQRTHTQRTHTQCGNELSLIGERREQRVDL